MEKITVIINPEYKKGDIPGSFLRVGIEIPKDLKGLEKDLAIRQAILDKLRWTIEAR